MPQVAEIDATYQVVTPCFCGGAGQRPELRVPSFKGVLRFWWRALARAQFRNLAEIQRREAWLFGSAAGGQSRVRIWFTSRAAAAMAPASRALRGQPGAQYLSYGMIDGERSCLQPPLSVTVRLVCRLPDHDDPDPAEVLRSLRDALVATGLFGGIGAKSRKGFGSLVLTGLRADQPAVQWSPPGTAAELTEQVARLAEQGSRFAEYPEYTAMSTHARYLLVDGGSLSPLRLVDKIGQEYKTHLREMGGATDLTRAGFGLPRHTGRAPETMEPVSFTRRASPLFIHINECDGRSVAVLAYLPAQFLPDAQNRVKAGTQELPAEISVLRAPVDDFLARLADADRRSPGFPQDVWEVGR